MQPFQMLQVRGVDPTDSRVESMNALSVFTLPETNIAPKNRPSQEEISSSNR